MLVFHPAAAPGLAAAMGLHERTARRLLFALEDEGYLQRGHGTRWQRYVFSPTPRLLALAGQVAARLPLMTQGQQVVRHLHDRTGLEAALVIPSYGDVLVLASAGDRAPAPWTLLPATDSAGGKVLLAYRDSWRDDQRPHDDEPPRLDLETLATEVREQGYALHDHSDARSLAVPVPMVPAPLAAVVLAGPRHALAGNARDAALAVLRDAAARLGDSRHWRRRAASTSQTPSTLRITAKDRDEGVIRIPNTAKRIFPAGKTNTIIRLRGTTVRARWNARRGRPERSGTLYVDRYTIQRLVEDNEVLAITVGGDGRIELN